MTDTLLTVVALLLLANLVLTLLVNERIRRAIREGTRQARDIGLARLEALREQLNREVVVRPDEDEIVSRLGRFALEASGEQSGIDQVIRVTARPAPAIVALGRDFAHYVFTTAAPEMLRDGSGPFERPRRGRVPSYPIDAATSGLTAAAELAAIWTLLAEQHVRPEERVLPRTARWYLYVVPQPSGAKPG